MGETKDVKDRESARRSVLKRLLVGGGVAATAKMLPDQWHKPVVESVILPAHAGTSDEPNVKPCEEIFKNVTCNVTYNVSEGDFYNA